MIKFTDFISQKLIYLWIIVLLLSNITTGSFLNKWKNKTDKDILKKWAPDLYGVVDTSLPKIANTDMNDILTNPTNNYIRAVLKHHNVCHGLIMDTILAYVGKNPFLLPFLIGESLTNDNNISFSPDYLYMVTRSKTIKVWLLQRGVCVRTLKQRNNSVMSNSVRIATNGEFIVSSAKFTINVWFPKEKQAYEIDSLIDEATYAFAISSDNFLIGSVSNGGSRVSVWEINSKQATLKWRTTHTHKSVPGFGPACEFFCNNSMLCVAQIEKKILLFSVAKGTIMYRMWTTNQTPFLFFILLPEKNQLFVGSESCDLFCVDLNEEEDVTVKDAGRSVRKQFCPIKIDLTDSNIKLNNTIKTIFLKMEESITPFDCERSIFSRSASIRMGTLLPYGEYCVLYNFIKKKIEIVHIDDLIKSYVGKSLLNDD